MNKPSPIKFVVDCMLGKLAKWLRILGFDTLFFSKAEDDELIDIARRENRLLLTRDTGIVEKAKKIKVVFIQSENWKEQVKQVLDELDLRDKVKPYSRCIECNVLLKSISKKQAKNLVAPFVYERSDSFSLCPRCGRVFWPGTHHSDMNFKIEDILEKD
ncbi:MAG TPA: Mut7-C RNAse domain-containing protein [Acidobacteriota bacterium]|nr:Mut7-C RNAse domain-containing protein [Acidobacteriota bacterium]